MAIALGVPLVLCCLPAFSDVRGLPLAANVIAAMIFYSFLLLPTSCKFDFRRDVERLVVLKSLPVSPLRIAVGQLAGPVAITLLFQLTVLVAAFLLNPSFAWWLIPATLGVMVPLNLVIFGFENLLFMYYPHRLNQEGVHVFIRTILAFTAKGLLFAAGLACVILWYFSSQWISSQWLQGAVSSNVVFGGGLVVALSLVATVIVRLLGSAFEKFDPSVDLAGLD